MLLVFLEALLDRGGSEKVTSNQILQIVKSVLHGNQQAKPSSVMATKELQELSDAQPVAMTTIQPSTVNKAASGFRGSLGKRPGITLKLSASSKASLAQSQAAQQSLPAVEEPLTITSDSDSE